MKGSGCRESKLPSMMGRIRLHADPGRRIITTAKRIYLKMIRQLGDEWFIIFWHTALVGRIVFGKQCVEKTTEFAFANETNVANLHRLIRVPWTWLPQSMSVRGISDGKLFAKYIEVGHRRSQESRSDVLLAPSAASET